MYVYMCVYMYETTKVGDAVSFKRVSAIDNVCNGQEGYPKEIFYIYMSFFIQLHVHLPFDEFTIGRLRIPNVAPTQLHQNS